MIRIQPREVRELGNNEFYNLDPSLQATRDHVLFDNGTHKVVYLGTQGIGEGDVEVNSYLIIDQDRGCLIDPGGYKIFPKVISNISKHIDPKRIDYLFMCHQDPDVAGSLPLWRKVSTAKVVVHWLWMRFLPHFGFENVDQFSHPLPDEGDSLPLGGCTLQFIPSHFLHSPGQFSVYDRVSRFLFTGDIGIALMDQPMLIVDSFERHVSSMRTVHERLMSSSNAIKLWLNKVRHLDIEAILPQHGAIMIRSDVPKFFAFLESLRCGTDLM